MRQFHRLMFTFRTLDLAQEIGSVRENGMILKKGLFPWGRVESLIKRGSEETVIA
jgi:hypothetical protein